MYASLLFSFDPRHRFYRLYDLQLRITMNIPFALLYIFLGGVFLYSAYSIWKKEKDHRR